MQEYKDLLCLLFSNRESGTSKEKIICPTRVGAKIKMELRPKACACRAWRGWSSEVRLPDKSVLLLLWEGCALSLSPRHPLY